MPWWLHGLFLEIVINSQIDPYIFKGHEYEHKIEIV